MRELANAQKAQYSIASWLRTHRSSLLLTEPFDFVEPSMAYRVELSYSRAGSLVDLGGGVSPTNGYLSELGMNVTVIDRNRGKTPGDQGCALRSLTRSGRDGTSASAALSLAPR
jgi:hypothetical protein